MLREMRQRERAKNDGAQMQDFKKYTKPIV